MRRISSLILLPLLVLLVPGRAPVHAAHLGGVSGPSCPLSPSVSLPPPSPAMGLQGTAPGGAFFALMGQTMAAKEPTKIVFHLTGHGPLTITAIGPDGRSLPPDWLEAHAPGGSTLDGVVPGDEWGSGWTFPTAGCWHLHAVRSDIVGDIDFSVAVPRLVGMAFTIVAPRQQPIHSGQTIVFSVQPDVQPGALESLSGRITIRHAGRTVRVLRLQGDVLDTLQSSIRLKTRSTMWFRAVATLTFRHITQTRTIRFQVLAR